MPDETIDQKLREMAEHRGFKLVKSRRRKPGTGDFGKFGLTQADGKPLLGISEEGLTASADDVETYLRNGSVSTWKASAESVPVIAVPTEKPKGQTKADDDEGAPVIRPRAKNAANGNVDSIKAAPKGRNDQRPEKSKSGVGPAGPASAGRRTAAPETTSRTREAAHAAPQPVPASRLHLRATKPADAAALAQLIGQLADVQADDLGIARNLESARKAKGGMVVAELDTLVGCCAWAIIPTIRHGLIGRITLIVVDEDCRRRGIATAMFEAASAALAKAGCMRVEAMSDIEIRNAHGFFRALKFEQASYRFAKALYRDS